MSYGNGRAADIRPEERQGTEEMLLSFEGDAPTAGNVFIVGPNGGAKDAGKPPVTAVPHGFGVILTATSPTVIFVRAPFAGTIKAWGFSSQKFDGDGLQVAVSATVKVWKKAGGDPTAADSINTSGVSIASAKEIRSTTLTDFTTLAISVGDHIAIHLESGADPVMFTLEYE